MMPVKFSLLLGPQHSISGIADAMRAIHIRDRPRLHKPESLNDFIILLEFLDELHQFVLESPLCVVGDLSDVSFHVESFLGP